MVRTALLAALTAVALAGGGACGGDTVAADDPKAVQAVCATRGGWKRA